MEPNFSPGSFKLPSFVNTRGELETVISERSKLEAELRDLESHMHSFEDSILKRGGPYFGRIAQGERADKIIEEVTKTAGEAGGNGNIDSESASECGKDRKIREADRLFSNSSVTSPACLNRKPDQTKVKVENFPKMQ